MRIILSRKGFDSAAGGIPSPILEDGTMLPLPIPSSRCPIRYRDVRLHNHELARVVTDLGGWRRHGNDRVLLTPESGAHLDPDLMESSYPRKSGWRPLFGQADTEVTVLENVDAGDLFLFFGWFRRAERRNGRYMFVPKAPNIHAIWGWLQVHEKIDLQQHHDAPAWTRYHPHFDDTERNGNVLFVSRTTLELPGASGLMGASAFRYYDERLRLTAPGQSRRSLWRLPGWFMPRTSEDALGYHGKDMTRWQRDGDYVRLRSVARGQEFILDASKYPRAVAWAVGLIQAAQTSSK